ncbi:hypothetical protein H2248_011183 [Termitomyces sp. 'cryptogamus']|nr:hypothetical protein H2248_011183 [Termitomyces sp. 'cryptogamus']
MESQIPFPRSQKRQGLPVVTVDCQNRFKKGEIVDVQLGRRVRRGIFWRYLYSRRRAGRSGKIGEWLRSWGHRPPFSFDEVWYPVDALVRYDRRVSERGRVTWTNTIVDERNAFSI